MKFESKFDPGEVVYHIIKNRKQNIISCGLCGGSGEIKGKDGRLRACPECYGQCYYVKYLDLEWKVSEQLLTVGQIRIEFIAHSTNNAQLEKRVESYMCYETGIGSGSIYYLDTLFDSQEDAQAECDMRNKEDKK